MVVLQHTIAWIEADGQYTGLEVYEQSITLGGK